MNKFIQNKNELFRGYYRFSKAWFATDRDIERSTVIIGMYYSNGATAGEISVEWETVNDQKIPVLTAYNDGWKTLSTFTDLVKEMAKLNNKNISEEQFSKLLDKTGFTDLTPYSQRSKSKRQFPNAPQLPNKRLK